jgi:hypothetical protein
MIGRRNGNAKKDLRRLSGLEEKSGRPTALSNESNPPIASAQH